MTYAQHCLLQYFTIANIDNQPERKKYGRVGMMVIKEL